MLIYIIFFFSLIKSFDKQANLKFNCIRTVLLQMTNVQTSQTTFIYCKNHIESESRPKSFKNDKLLAILSSIEQSYQQLENLLNDASYASDFIDLENYFQIMDNDSQSLVSKIDNAEYELNLYMSFTSLMYFFDISNDLIPDIEIVEIEDTLQSYITDDNILCFKLLQYLKNRDERLINRNIHLIRENTFLSTSLKRKKEKIDEMNKKYVEFVQKIKVEINQWENLVLEKNKLLNEFILNLHTQKEKNSNFIAYFEKRTTDLEKLFINIIEFLNNVSIEKDINFENNEKYLKMKEDMEDFLFFNHEYLVNVG